MDSHPQATVVLFPCSLSQGFKEATMGNHKLRIMFVCLFLAPQSVARGGSVAIMRENRVYRLRYRD